MARSSGEVSERKRSVVQYSGMKSSWSRCQIAEGPPVPIPNTEVKLRRAEDTLPETARENRSMPTLRGRVTYLGAPERENTPMGV